MSETKAKYHHLIPRTYLSAWEHGNGTLYIIKFETNGKSGGYVLTELCPSKRF